MKSFMRQRAAHQVVKSKAETTFFDILSEDSRVKNHLSGEEIKQLLDPATYTGLNAKIACETSVRASGVVNIARQ